MVLDSALVALEQPGLRASEASRLNNIIQGVKVYQQLFSDFVNYQALESEVLELRKQLAVEKIKFRVKFLRTYNFNEIQSQWQGLQEEYRIHQAAKHTKVDAVKGEQQDSLKKSAT